VITIPPLHQSMAKVLVSQCPAIAKAQLDAGGKAPTRAMERGSLVDQLVFGGANFHVIDADSYRTKAAQQQRDAAREQGMVPVLAHEYEPAREMAGIIKSRLMCEGIELDKCAKQRTLTWTTRLGNPAEGTPDLFLQPCDDGRRVVTVDLKVGASADPDKLDFQIYDMGWDIQAYAYQEAVYKNYSDALECPGTHFLVVAEMDSGANCVTVAPLDTAYMDIGRHRWERAQAIWRHCWEFNYWPEYQSRPLTPPKSVLYKEGIVYA
jgi:PDDEXK-like domain of unknown function (DUF3799)